MEKSGERNMENPLKSRTGLYNESVVSDVEKYSWLLISLKRRNKSVITRRRDIFHNS